MKRITTLFLPIICLFFMACSTLTAESLAKMHADELYKNGKAALSEGEYSVASKYLEALITNYPFGKYAEQGQLDLIYAYYQSGDVASTLATANSFIHLYPMSKHVDYAYYMKGVADMEVDRGLLLKYLPADLTYREPNTMHAAYSDFNQLILRFPDSKYVPDARQRMIYLRNFFAQHEMNIANYYMGHNAYVAAANRAADIVKKYQQAPVVPEALALMEKAYRRLGLNESAKEVEQVIQSSERRR